MLQSNYTSCDKQLTWINSLTPFLESDIVVKFYKKGILAEIEDVLMSIYIYIFIYFLELDILLINQRKSIADNEAARNKAEDEYRYVLDQQRKYYVVLFIFI